MSIKINLSTTLRPLVKGYNPNTGLTLEYPEKQNCAQLAQTLGIDPALIKLTMVNGKRYEMDDVIEDGDRVAFFPPVGGG